MIQLEAAILGIANHLLFQKYEPTDAILVPTVLLLLLEPLLFSIASRTYLNSFLSMPDLSTLFGVYTTFYVTLLASVALYRVSPFHPLADIPGPISFKLSKFAPLWYYWWGDQAPLFQSLHDKYGPVVRVAPNEISVAELEAVDSVLGGRGLPKGSSYIRFRVRSGPENLVTMNGDEHSARRRIWNRAMSTDALREYEAIIADRALELADHLDTEISQSKGEVDICQWLNYFTFDFMSDMGFGAGFNMMKEGDVHKLWPGLTLHMRCVSLLSHLPWIPDIRDRLPGFSMPLWPIARRWSANRLQKPAQKKDIWYHLMDEAGLEKVKPSLAEVGADAVVTIIAGADTTSCTMSFLFYLLLSHPECYKRAQEEIDAAYPPGSDPLDVSKHSNLPYLAACIQETLRLFPPAPVSGAREVPADSGGVEISGHYLPEGTQVWCPPQVFHRNPEYFSPRTDEFVPERWMQSTETEPGKGVNPESEQYKNEMGAFLAFSYGPANCAGRKLAKLEMLMVMSLLMSRFDFRFADSFDWANWPKTLKSYFVVIRQPIPVTITRRSSVL